MRYPLLLILASSIAGKSVARLLKLMPLWKNGKFVEDHWRMIEDDAPLPEGEKAIVSLKRWRDQKGMLAERNAPLGLLIPPGSVWMDIVTDLPRFPVIALTIPKYADGRASSIARLLRERDGYKGEIRVSGDYIIDQMPFMMRVGIDAFEVENPVALKALERGEWPEVKNYLQPAFEHGTEIPAGTRPWARKPAVKG